MTSRVQTYNDELLLALRVRDVPAPRIAEAVAEVHSHVAETGEDPVEAFGPPRDYALQVAAALGQPDPSASSWRGVLTWSAAAYGLAGAAGTWLLLEGVIALASGRSALGLPPAVPSLVGVALLVGLVVGLTRLARRDAVAVLDPRTGEDLAPPLPHWVLPAMVAPAALSIALAVGVLLTAR